jgi:hypothetical protein
MPGLDPGIHPEKEFFSEWWIAGSSPAMTSFVFEGDQHDRVSDIALIGRPDRDRGVGGTLMSAKIIQFAPRPHRERREMDSSTIAFRSAPGPDDLTMDHVDTSPCEYVRPDSRETKISDG